MRIYPRRALFVSHWQMGIDDGDETGTHVRPCHEVVGAVIKRHNHRMLHDSIWQLQIKRVFNEVEDGLASGCLSPHFDVCIQMKIYSNRITYRLRVHGLEIKAHVWLEPVLDWRSTLTKSTRPIA